MTGSRWSVVALCVLFAGCGGGCGSAVDTPEEQPAAGEAGGDETQVEAPAAEPEPPVDPGPAPVLRVLAEPDSHGPTVAIRIENRGAEAAELRGALGLQRRDGEAWADVEGVGLDLRFSCEDAAPECVTLAPGGAYLPPAWLGSVGDAQCECERCAAAPAGDYRLVVQSCNGAHTIEGESFTISAD